MLKKTHVQTYEAIKKLTSEKGFPPTINEIAGARKISPTSAYKHIIKLIGARMLQREPGKGRTITLTK